MIFFAQDEDLASIQDLWIECFSQVNWFFMYFFNNIYKKENTLVYKIDEKIVAMVQMLPYDTSLGKSTYIYALATTKNFRKQGIADKLLEKSFEISKQRGHKYSFLIPEGEKLFNFYKKYGYNSCLNVGYHEFLSEKIHGISKEQLKAEDIPSVLQIYQNADKGEFYILRDREFIIKQIEIYKTGALKYLENDKIIGYSFGRTIENKTIIEEIFSSDINKCLSTHEKGVYKTYGNNQKKGVIKSLLDENTPKGYISLMFD